MGNSCCSDETKPRRIRREGKCLHQENSDSPGWSDETDISS